MRVILGLLFTAVATFVQAHEPQNGIKFISAYDKYSEVFTVLVSNTSRSQGRYLKCVAFDGRGVPLSQSIAMTVEYATELDFSHNGSIRANEVKNVKCHY